MKKNFKDIISKEQNNEYWKATNCFICDSEFDKDYKNWKVIEHDHYTGKYKGPACNNCNLQYKVKFIPVIFHNLSGYDCYLFIKDLGFDNSDIKVIANLEEKYLSFSKMVKIAENVTIELRFIDFLRFLNSSSEKLVFITPDEKFIRFKRYIRNESVNLRKGVCSYEYIDSFDKWN